VGGGTQNIYLHSKGGEPPLSIRSGNETGQNRQSLGQKVRLKRCFHRTKRRKRGGAEWISLESNWQKRNVVRNNLKKRGGESEKAQVP